MWSTTVEGRLGRSWSMHLERVSSSLLERSRGGEQGAGAASRRCRGVRRRQRLASGGWGAWTGTRLGGEGRWQEEIGGGVPGILEAGQG